jgi:hypothetical protein
MSTSYKDIRNDRQWKAVTGLSQNEFFSLSSAFKNAYEMMFEKRLVHDVETVNKEAGHKSYEDCLYFVLFQLKNDLTNDCLGVLFNMDGSHAHRDFKRLLEVLELALRQKDALPNRHFQTVKEFKKFLEKGKVIIADGIEYPVERPSDQQKQKECYSGKKKDTPLNR